MKIVVKVEQKLVSLIKNETGTELSLRAIKKALEKGICKVNGELKLFASQNLHKGDIVELFDDWAKCINLEKLSFPILYEDDYYIIVNKPPNFVCEDENLKKFFKNCQLVHRLDKETSGALMLAKSQKAFEAMKELFKKREVEKGYLAWVEGRVEKNVGEKISFLEKGRGMRWRSAKRGLLAKTCWRVLKRRGNSSLLYVETETGRTHQIRVHLSEINHPILGDYLYGREFSTCVKRLMLHSQKIAFIHPFLQKKIEVKCHEKVFDY